MTAKEKEMTELALKYQISMLEESCRRLTLTLDALDKVDRRG